MSGTVNQSTMSSAQRDAVTPTPPLDDVVDDWLATNNLDSLQSLERLSSEDLQELIAALGTSQGNPANTVLLNALKNSRYTAPANATPLERKLGELQQRAAVLNALANSPAGRNNPNFRLAATKVEGQVIAVTDLLNLLRESAQPWSAGPQAVLNQVEALINQIDAVQATGVDTATLGLNNLKTNLQATQQRYQEATQGVAPNSKEAQLALSNLRESYYQDKVNFAPGSKAAMAGVRGEQLRQSWLEAPTEDATASPKAVNLQEMDATLSDLKLQYEAATSQGKRDLMSHILSKIQNVAKARDQLREGADPLVVGVSLFQSLRMTDMAHKKIAQSRLREEIVEKQKQNSPDMEAQIADLNSQVDALEAELDALTKQLQQIMTQFEQILNTRAQGVTDALAKAL